MSFLRESQMTKLIDVAMLDCDRFVVEFVYCDARGNRTRRVVSPIRFAEAGRTFIGLCLSREEPRQFSINRIREVSLRAAHDYLMPVPLVEVPFTGKRPVSRVAVSSSSN